MVPAVTGECVVQQQVPESLCPLDDRPLHKDAWPFPQKLVSVILSKLADVGGPRCCKRTSRIAIEEAIRFYRQFSSVKIPLSSVLCKYFEDNKECIREDCPYYPVNK